MRFAKRMSFPPIVIVTRFVAFVTEGSCVDSRSDVFAPEQATKVSVLPGCFCAHRYGVRPSVGRLDRITEGSRAHGWTAATRWLRPVFRLP